MRRLEEDFAVSGQISPEDVPILAARGFRTIVNNRPDGEAPGQPEGAAIADAAAAAGLAYRAIPVSQLTADAVEETRRTLEEADGPIFAFCAAGTRSTYLWALARSQQGRGADDLLARAAEAGVDLTPIRRFLR